jgi:hypothetical protein
MNSTIPIWKRPTLCSNFSWTLKMKFHGMHCSISLVTSTMAVVSLMIMIVFASSAHFLSSHKMMCSKRIINSLSQDFTTSNLMEISRCIVIILSSCHLTIILRSSVSMTMPTLSIRAKSHLGQSKLFSVFSREKLVAQEAWRLMRLS